MSTRVSSATLQPRAGFDHKRKQIKFILTGGTITWFTGILSRLQTLLEDATGIARFFTLSSAILGIATIALFLFVVLLPRIRGANPNYANWRDSPDLAAVIPVLTGCMVGGWSCMVLTLSMWSSLGTLWSIIGASGLYALAFGLIGLIPTPDY